MNDVNCYLFVYGTLLNEQNIFGAYLKENSVFIAKAKTRGFLYDIGSYPGLVLGLSGDDFVYGSVFKMNDPTTVLEKLDYYEGFGDSYAQPNEFWRELALFESDNDPLECWVYLYNHPVDELPVIKSGNYKDR